MSDLPPPSLPAGWYPDPKDKGRQRYWDGENWTQKTIPIPKPKTLIPKVGAGSGTVSKAVTPPKKGGLGCARIGCLSIIGIVVVGGIIAAIVGATGNSSSDDKSDLAVVACQDVVKKNLKAPSTASFPDVPSVSGNIITGEVDAENGFGAHLRASFQCTIADDNRVKLDYLTNE